jgi:hypothetical protein
MGLYLAHNPLRQLSPVGKFGRLAHATAVVTMRLGRARRHGGEVANGESAAQMSCSLHQREVGRAEVAPDKFMSTVAHRDDVGQQS